MYSIPRTCAGQETVPFKKAGRFLFASSIFKASSRTLTPFLDSEVKLRTSGVPGVLLCIDLPDGSRRKAGRVRSGSVFPTLSTVVATIAFYEWQQFFFSRKSSGYWKSKINSIFEARIKVFKRGSFFNHSAPGFGPGFFVLAPFLKTISFASHLFFPVDQAKKLMKGKPVNVQHLRQ